MLNCVVRSETAEVGMHSNVIYSLIDPHGSHYQGNLFLQHFISDVLAINDFGTDITVQAEESTYEENRRIDFTIKSKKYYIGIEMKINAHDSKYQLFDYYKDLMEKAKGNKINEKNVKIYYLTKSGGKASINSYKKDGRGIEYEQISFKKHILKWIDSCQKEVRNITNLNEAFNNYRSIVEKITNQYQRKVMQLKDELLKDKKLFVLAEEVSRAFEKAVIELELEFWQNLIKSLKEKGIIIEKQEKISKNDLEKIIREENNTEVNIIFEIGDIEGIQKTKLKMQVGTKKNWGNGSPYITIFQTKNNQWDDGPNKDIAKLVKDTQTIQLTKEKWCYGTCLINSNIELRSEKLYEAKSHIEELSDIIAGTIKELKELLGQYLSI